MPERRTQEGWYGGLWISHLAILHAVDRIQFPKNGWFSVGYCQLLDWDVVGMLTRFQRAPAQFWSVVVDGQGDGVA